MDGVNDSNAGSFYHGKKVAYIYKAKTPVSGSKFRVVWGKIMRSHGSNGVLRAKFATNLSVSVMIQYLMCHALNSLPFIVAYHHRFVCESDVVPKSRLD